MTRLLWLVVIGLLVPMVMSQQDADNDDLCANVKCKKPRGAMCRVVLEEGVAKPKCVCPKSCDGEPEKTVCSVFGQQYENLCEFHKYQCKKKKSIPLAFEKPCIAPQTPCTNEEYSQFPLRLLEWFMHLKEEEEYGRIDPNRHIAHLDKTQREAVAMWKFDAMDINEDDQLDKRELLHFRYALMPLEHCASPFFSRCAKMSSDPKRISDNEWIDCLKVNDQPEQEENGEVLTAEALQKPVEAEEDEEDVEDEQEGADA